MKLNADFTQRAAEHGAQIEWLASPMPGVHRRMLDRIGEEVARATTIVRYAPGSQFSPHTHGGGEEFVVLEGTFQDEHGDYPAGSYVRNPPQSSHTPGAEDGCVILVKLWQFDLEDRNQVRIFPQDMQFVDAPDRPGCRVCHLHQDEREAVFLEQWEPNREFSLEAHGGLELLVLEGSLEEGGETFAYQSWLRLPPQQPLHAKVGPQGARFWCKTGHLRIPPTAPQKTQ